MGKHEKTISILESFLSDYVMEGACGFFIDPEIDVHSNYLVYIIIDLDFIKNIQRRPAHVGKAMRDRLKEEIKKYTGLDVTVGSTTKKCSDIKESVRKDYIITESQYRLIIKSQGNLKV